ncbi:MAG: fold metallo-hydrolase [Herminiimonas sp.]|nr:fold metallo-hydrolase [Herminiimonas sp.]
MMTSRIKKRLAAVAGLICMMAASASALAQAHPGGIHSAKGINPPSGKGKEQTLALTTPAQAAKAGEGSVMFVGTATVLIRYAGFTILTDPNFLHKGDHVHLGYGLTSERLTNPAIDMDQLPPVDLVLLSHLHGDHFDQLVQQKLDRNVPILTTPDGARELEKMGFKATYPLGTWESLTVTRGKASVRITSMPGRHGPPVAAALLPEVMGSMLDFSPEGAGKPSYRMYISGDTLVYDDIEEIPRRFSDIDLALLHLGGTRILGVMKVTMDGKDGVRMMQIIAPQRAIPIHYNDYGVFKSPLADFEKEVNAAGLQGKVTYLKHGESYAFRPAR